MDRVDNGGDADNGYAYTKNGGVSWSYGFLPGLTYAVNTGCPRPSPSATGDQCTFDRASDAVIAWGKDPANPTKYIAYANTLVFNDGSISGDTQGLNSGMAMNISHDGGTTWSSPVFLEQDNLAGLNDKNWIVADNGTGAGHHTGRVYNVWDRVAPMVYTYCDPDVASSIIIGTGCEHKENWTSANNNSFYVFNPGPGIGSYPIITPQGGLGILFEGDFAGTCPVPPSPTDQPDCGVGTQLQYILAPAAGAVAWPLPLTFNPAVALGVGSNQSTCCAEQRAGTLPSFAVDPVSGQLYAAWEDSRYRTDGKNDILVSTSSNPAGLGGTWSVPVRVNQDPVNDKQNHWDAMIDVGADGKVHVAYMQRDETGGPAQPWSPSGFDRFLHAYYQESTDHGNTWTAPLQVDTVGTDVGYGAYSRGGEFQGDYNQISQASNGWSYIVRTVAYAKTPGEPCNCSFTNSSAGHQHQYTWVSVVGPPPAVIVPEVPWTPALALLGLGSLLLLRRGRRARTAS